MLCLTQKCTDQNYSIQLKQLVKRLPQPPTNYGSINANLQKARKELREIKQCADSLCTEYLDALLTTAKQMGDKSRQHLIFHLHQAKLN